MNDTLEGMWNKFLIIGCEIVDNKENYKDKWKQLENTYKTFDIKQNISPCIPILNTVDIYLKVI